MKKLSITTLLLIICVGCRSVGDGAELPSPTSAAISYPSLAPFPTPSATAPPVPLSPTPLPTPRKIPLRRSDSDGAQGAEEASAYRLEEDVVIRGGVSAESLRENEMMCVQHLDQPPTITRCICWIGPLENAGVSGSGLYGMRRITILSGSVEEAAISLMEDWRSELSAASDREPCRGEEMSVSFGGGVFQPEP